MSKLKNVISKFKVKNKSKTKPLVFDSFDPLWHARGDISLDDYRKFDGVLQIVSGDYLDDDDKSNSVIPYNEMISNVSKKHDTGDNFFAGTLDSGTAVLDILGMMGILLLSIWKNCVII